MKKLQLIILFILSAILIHLPSTANAQNDKALQELKRKILLINQELTTLEEELLYPNTEIALYISVDVGTGIRLNDVLVKIDDKEVAAYVYDEREYAALVQGGIDKIYSGNLSSGNHTITTQIRGINANGVRYENSDTFSFNKGEKPAYIEVKAADDNSRGQHKIQYFNWK